MPKAALPDTPAAIIAIAVRAVRQEADGTSAPPVLAVSPDAVVADAPEILVRPGTGAPEAGADTPAVTVVAREDETPSDKPAKRITASVLVSIVLHVGVLALFVYLSLALSAPTMSGDDAVPVELVVAAEAGAASQQETASGREETRSEATAAEQRTAVEAPPVETPPEPPVADTSPTAADEPPVAQPDPVTTAERILDQLPPPPMPDTLPIAELAPPVAEPAEAQPVTEPVQEAPTPPTAAAEAQPVQETPPQPAQDPTQRVETQAPSEVQAMVSPPTVQPPTPPRLASTPPRAVTPPAVRRQPTREAPVRRPPPTRREAPTDASRTRPTRQVAATPSPERQARPVRQTESRASAAPRGDGTGQRNRQASAATGTGGASSAAAMASYRSRVLAHLARFKVYPDSARERGITGRTGIAFTLNRSGGVTAVSISSSSGAPILDQATLAMVRRAVPFPPMPEGGASSMSFNAGMTYNLR